MKLQIYMNLGGFTPTSTGHNAKPERIEEEPVQNVKFLFFRTDFW